MSARQGTRLQPRRALERVLGPLAVLRRVEAGKEKGKGLGKKGQKQNRLASVLVT